MKIKSILIFSLHLIFLNISVAQTIVATYSGNGQASLVDSNLLNASFNGPTGMCRDKSGNIFIADASNNCIRKIDASGNVSIYAGAATTGYVDGPALTSRFNNPFSVCVDDSGNIYVSD